MINKKLTDKQEMFCNEYLVDLNATQAAIRSGYSNDTAAVIGCENLIKPNIQARIVELKAKRLKRIELSQDDVLRVWKNAISFDVRKLFNDDGSLKKLSELDDETALAISSIDYDDVRLGNKVVGKTTKVKTLDKLKAGDSIAKYLGMYEIDNEQKKSETNVNFDWSKLTLEQKIAMKKASITNAVDES